MMETLFDVQEYHVEPEFDNDDWETPSEVARFMASLVSPGLRVWEPSAGTGNIAMHLPDYNEITCSEVNPLRVEVGKIKAPHCDWICENSLGFARKNLFDVVIGNPPFSLGCEFLAVADIALRETGSIFFLLPTEYFQAKKRATAFAKTGLVIAHQWQITGRVSFVKNGKVVAGRMCGDTVFEFCKKSWCEGSVTLVDPYSKGANRENSH
jgi:predicted RNA methylase